MKDAAMIETGKEKGHLTTAPDRVAEARSVLLVEKRVAFRQAIACLPEWCTGSGHASQGNSSTDARSSAATDVMIVDLCRSIGDGSDLIRSLRENHPGATVLALTRGQDPEYYARAVRAGASMVLNEEASLGEILHLARSLGVLSSARSGTHLLDPSGTPTTSATLKNGPGA